MNRLKRSIIILLLGITLYSQTPTNNEIILTPITNAYLFNNFYEGLNPFMHSTKTVKLDNLTNLRLLDEIEYSNGLFGDILKVEVISGNYKGEVGYILEESLALISQSLKNEIYLFFKNEADLNNNFKIDKETKCSVLESRTEYGQEILTLKLLSSSMKDMVIKYNNKDNLHFIIDKQSEINYFLRKGFKVIKIVDSNTLLPIEDALSNESHSDEVGIIYIDNKNSENKIEIQKDGFTKSIINLTGNNNVYLSFITPLDTIRHLDEKISIYQKNNFSIILKHKEKSVFKKIGIKVLEENNLSAFCFPSFFDENYLIQDGFYITNTDAIEELSYEVKEKDEKYKIIYYDENLLKWINLYFIKDNDKLIISKIKDGYYLIISENKNEAKKITLSLNKNVSSSQLFIRGEKGKYYSQVNKNIGEYSLSIPDEKCEISLFTAEVPEKILQYNIANNASQTSLNITNYINNKNENNQELSKLFYGKWFRKIIKIDENIYKDENMNILELLGDMFIESSKKISFSNKDLIISGSLEIIDGSRLYIHINYVNKPVKSYEGSNLICVNASLFSSQLLIPAFYSFRAGIFQISFDNIFFERKRYINKKSKNDDNDNVRMISMPFGNPIFPDSEKKSKYQLFFTQY